MFSRLICLMVPFSRKSAHYGCYKWLLGLILLGTLVGAEVAIAQTSQPVQLRERVTPVSELTDVESTHWAYQALKSLVERHGVLVGYPDGTFRGDRAMTRYEFAAALNTLMNLLTPATQEELEVIKRLQAEFARELAAIKGKLENVETLLNRAQPFSTTTKLTGEVIFAVVGVGDTEKPDGSGDRTDNHLIFGNRTRLTFDTSFIGKDRLRMRLQAGNIADIDEAAGTTMARLAFQEDSENQFELSKLSYRFPFGKKATIYIDAAGGGLSDLTDTLNPMLGPASYGAISRFASKNPIYRQGGDSGIGINYEFNDGVSLSLGYLAEDGNNPLTGLMGIGEGAYGAIAQLTVEPNDNLAFGLTYIRSYNSIDTKTGSRRANDPFNDQSDAIAANSFGIQSTLRIKPNLTLAGWFGFTHASAQDLSNDPKASIVNFGLTLSISDLIKEGSLVGFAIGLPPKVISNDFTVDDDDYTDPDTSIQLEAFYRYPVSDNIAITVGGLVVTNPEHNRDNDTVYVGTIRTTFSF
jgi:Carbohydrate-selective porin, OprB family/S-layer homology domain